MTYTYTIEKALSDLENKFTETDAERLEDFYPSYLRPHRHILVDALLQGYGPINQLAVQKLFAKGLVKPSVKQSMGGHTHWVVSKLRKTAIRTLYTRYRVDGGLNRRQANAILYKKFWSPKAKYDAGASNIRKSTLSPSTDHIDFSKHIPK